MRILYILLFSCTICLLGKQKCDGQSKKKEKDVQEFIPTDNVDSKKEFNKKKNAPKRKEIRLIIKNNTKWILYGNPCMIEETRKMGFEYAVQTKGIPGSLGFFGRTWNNFQTKFVLTFTRSPFWKLILKSRVKDCRIKSGDLVG